MGVREEIALERIERLFDLAGEAADDGDLERAHYFVDLAVKISSRTNTPIPAGLKRKKCSHCNHFLKPGVNCRVRLDSQRKRVDVKCLDCKEYTYYPYVREKNKG